LNNKSFSQAIKPFLSHGFLRGKNLLRGGMPLAAITLPATTCRDSGGILSTSQRGLFTLEKSLSASLKSSKRITTVALSEVAYPQKYQGIFGMSVVGQGQTDRRDKTAWRWAPGRNGHPKTTVNACVRRTPQYGLICLS
jgi:hypothetical protein